MNGLSGIPSLGGRPRVFFDDGVLDAVRVAKEKTSDSGRDFEFGFLHVEA